MKSEPKMGRPKKRDALSRGAFNGGFWDSDLKKIGKEIIDRGFMTPGEWSQFYVPNGDWIAVFIVACNPRLYLVAGKRSDGTFVRAKSATSWQKALCDLIVRWPSAIPYLFFRIREEVPARDLFERWLGRVPNRTRLTDKELAELFNAAPFNRCVRITAKQVEWKRRNLERRLKKAAIDRVPFPAK